MLNHPLLRKFLGVLTGAILGFAAVALIEAAGHGAFPPPAGTDLSDPAVMATLMDKVPLAAKLIVVLAWFVGALLGGYVAARIAREPRAAWIIAGIFIVMTALTIASFPHPMWMVVAGLLAPMAAAWLVSARLAHRI